MRKLFTGIFVVISTIIFISVALTYNQVKQEEERLVNDINYRSILLTDGLRESVEPNFINKSDAYLQDLVERYAHRQRIAGLVILDNNGEIIAASSSIPNELSSFKQIALESMDADSPNGEFEVINQNKLYVFATPLRDQSKVVGALSVVQNASYVDSRLKDIWAHSLLKLFTQVFLFVILAIVIMYLIVYEPLRRIVESLQNTGNDGGSSSLANMSNTPLFRTLTREVSQIQRNLIQAKQAVYEEAKISLEKLDSPWTAERLQVFIEDIAKNKTITVVSNREPYIHNHDKNTTVWTSPASGMVTALDAMMKACGGTWIAQASGDADKKTANEKGEIQVPPNDPRYTLHRVWLSQEQVAGYYNGFCNEALWPLCHQVHARPIFREQDWQRYKEVNELFAKKVLKKISREHKPLVLVQDFHFALLPRLIKKQRPDATIGLFWHIPWTSEEAFSVCPWKKEIIDGMLGSDLIGFHIQLHCNNFINTVSHELESLIDYESFTITKEDHVTWIKPFPISIDFTNGISPQTIDREERAWQNQVRHDYGISSKYIGLGVDRLDYTKGILERIKAIEIFLHQNPTYQKNFTFIQVAAPTRVDVPKYKQFASEVRLEVDRVNSLFKTRNWQPILLLEKHRSHEEIYQFYRLADVCLVTSLHDGMNLVAKEFVSARYDHHGVLVLSEFAGASRELKESIIVNPYSGEEVAQAIYQALKMSPKEQMKRMKKLRRQVRDHNIYRWSAEFLKTLVDIG